MQEARKQGEGFERNWPLQRPEVAVDQETDAPLVVLGKWRRRVARELRVGAEESLPGEIIFVLVVPCLEARSDGLLPVSEWINAFL
ncbi:MAG: hypothetical protein ABSB49_21845 [Polyangia bacterium]